MSKRVYWLWLANRHDLDAGVIRRLTHTLGTPEFLYGAGRDAFIAAGLNQRQTDALCDKDLSQAQEILRTCDEQKIQIITIEDSAYPEILREIADPPPVLYVKGTLPDFDCAPAIAIVGTRACSAYGLRMAEKFGAALAKAGFTILSGMALGADAAAHRGCLKAGGRTVAVLAGGVDTCYPPENRYLKGDITLSGAVISENPPGTPNEGFRFPIRNRIISGLSVATLVVEAPARSGALISARTAFEQGREVFAVPGPLDVPGSVGCNQLIRDEVARIATHPMDIVHELELMLRDRPRESLVRTAWLHETGAQDAFPSDCPVQPYRTERGARRRDNMRSKPEPAPAVQGKPPAQIPDALGQEAKQIVQAIQQGADTVDAVSERTGFPAAQIASTLVLLELEGIAEHKAGRCRLL